MTTLVTGGTSQVGFALSKLLKAAGKDVIIAARTPSKVPSEYKSVVLDWSDPSTFENPFRSHQIENVYILPPPASFNAFEIAKPFIDLAIEKGVKKFVLLSATIFEKGSLGLGLVHEYLETKNVDYFVLRPTWFIENLFNLHGYSIKNQGEIITTVAKGRIPFIGIEDVAQAAFEYLTQGSSHKDILILGPEPLTYNEVVQILTEVIGKPITHKVVTPEEQLVRYTTVGIPEDFAKSLIAEEAKSDTGSEAALVERDNKFVGNHTVRNVLERNKAFWSS